MAKHTAKPVASRTEHAAVKGFTQRLRQIIGERSVHRFAREAGLSDSLLRKYLNGSHPGLDRLVQLADAGEVSVQWLATGREADYSRYANITEGALIDSDGSEQTSTDYVRIPWYSFTGTVADSLPGPAPLLPAFHLEWLAHEKLDVNTLACILVKGNAMTPTMREGDLLLVDTAQNSVSNEGTYVLRAGKGAIVKRLQHDLQGGLRVSTDNPDITDQQLSAQAAKDLDIIGRVVWLGKRIE